jgi:hypothetical protein
MANLWLLAATTMAAAGTTVEGASLPAGPLKTFGTGRSAFQYTDSEMSLFKFTVGATARSAAMTHFWTTGSTDTAIFRYYIDGETTASIEFTPPAASGAFFGDAQMWGTSKIGRGSSRGGWFVNIKIPFGNSVNVTIQAPSGAGRGNGFVILRGCENVPVHVGDVLLPPQARLQLHRIEAKTFQPLEFVPIVDVPSGQGLVLMTAIAANSSSNNFWEGCYHLYTPHKQLFPGTVLSTGMEGSFVRSPTLIAHSHDYVSIPCPSGLNLDALRFLRLRLRL